MIPSSLYPTAGSYDVGFTSSEYSITYTDAASSSSISWDGSMDAYALGYINPDQLPNSMAISHVFITEEDNVDDRNIVIQRISPSTNAQIGYAMKSDLSSTTYYRTQDGVVSSGDLSNMRFVNNFFPEFVATKSQVTLYIKWFVTVSGSSTIYYSSDSQVISFEGDTTYYSWLQFKNGATITKNLTISGNNYGDITYGYSDFNKGRFSGTTTTGAQVSGFCVGFSFLTTSYRSGYSSGNINYAFAPLINYSGTYSYGEISGDVEQTYCRLRSNNTSSHSGIALYNFTYNSGQGRLTNIHYEDGFGDDVFNVGELKSTFNSGSVPINTHIYTDETLVVKEDNNPQVTFFPLRRFEEIDETFALYSRFTSVISPPVSYRSNMTYCCDVNSANLFSIHFKTGDITDENFKEGLQPWQYVDRDNPEPENNGTENTNDFDPTDPNQMPPYTPEPPPTPSEEGHNPDNPELSLGDTEDVPGDSVEPDEHRNSPIQFPVSAFMTQYVLTASDVYSMGRTLWSGMGDSASQMASNFVKTYTSTGTINIANLMDFFVSVKCFPFDMTDIAYGWSAPSMTVGTGAVPILNSSVWVLGVSTYIVDCGTVATTENAFKLGVNSNSYDFRNYVNCTISCFLPYCGTVELNPADVFPYTLSCKYFVDMLSGSCTAVIWAERPDGSVPVASKTGQIGKIVPISATNVMGVAGQAISGVSNIFQTVGEVVISAAKRRALGATQAPINEASKNKEYLQEMANYNKSQTDIGNKYSDAGSGLGAITGAASGIGNLMTRNGVGIPSLGAGVGLEAMHISERPYIVIRRLNYSSPNNYAHTTGFASTDGGGENNKSTIGAYSGWTVFQNVDLSGIYGTKEELEEIKMLLETGVYL